MDRHKDVDTVGSEAPRPTGENKVMWAKYVTDSDKTLLKYYKNLISCGVEALAESESLITALRLPCQIYDPLTCPLPYQTGNSRTRKDVNQQMLRMNLIDAASQNGLHLSCSPIIKRDLLDSVVINKR